MDAHFLPDFDHDLFWEGIRQQHGQTRKQYSKKALASLRNLDGLEMRAKNVGRAGAAGWDSRESFFWLEKSCPRERTTALHPFGFAARILLTPFSAVRASLVLSYCSACESGEVLRCGTGTETDQIIWWQ